MGKHALLSASSSQIWLNCPPSARLSQQYEDKGSSYAAEGTDAHTLCEYKLKTALGIKAKDPSAGLAYYNEEMEECATSYATYILELVEKAKQECADPMVLIEQRLDFSKYVEGGFGTGDALIIADGTIHIVDYKHGQGVLVESEDNPQIKLYSLGALELFDGIYDINTVSLTIYQPRRDNISTHTVSKESLYQWANEVLKPTALLAYALATFFSVSRTAAKIRMIDAGYEEAIGTFTYIDGRYVKPHRFKKGALERNQTFSIGAEDAAIQSITNPEMAALVRDGSYIYVDSHFVLNHPKYITRDIFGQTVLTDYARTHMEECCLVFDLSVRSSVRERYHSECFLNRDETSTISFDIVYGKGYQFASPEKKVKLLADVLTENARIYSSLPNDLTACLKIVREWRGVTFQELSDRTFLNERTIRRIVNGEEKGSLNSLILICLALHLPPEISFHIIDKSPFSLTYSNQDHIWYDFALKYKYSLTMDEIRAFLQEHGAEAL
jgi:transcriptional regulator with XRE-family HTH domain/DNA-binding XRE family transcriptional regulator